MPQFLLHVPLKNDTLTLCCVPLIFNERKTWRDFLYHNMQYVTELNHQTVTQGIQVENTYRRLLPSSLNKAFHFHRHVAVIPCNMTAVPTVAIIGCLQLPHATLALNIIAVTFDTSKLIAVNQFHLCSMATSSLTGRYHRCTNAAHVFF